MKLAGRIAFELDPHVRQENARQLLRTQEAQLVEQRLRRDQRALEVGGGDGLQAAMLVARCRSLVVLELPMPEGRRRSERYPVFVYYGGSEMPFRDEAFDVVYSSHVLANLEDPGEVLDETRRVLRLGGVAFHAVPTPTWRVWTSASHPIRLLLLAIWYLSRHFPAEQRTDAPDAPLAKNTRSDAEDAHRAVQSTRDRVMSALWPVGLSATRSASRELIDFRRAAWKSLFINHGFELVSTVDGGLFYTGNCIHPGMELATRRRLARVLGDSSRLYVLRRVV